MFLDNLSVSLMQILDEYNISYEKAAELCNLSSRQVGNIIRRRSEPKLISLEKLCAGLGKTPNQLLGFTSVPDPVTVPMPITASRAFNLRGRIIYHPVCPSCGISLDRENQPYCGNCGQKLSWEYYSRSIILLTK